MRTCTIFCCILGLFFAPFTGVFGQSIRKNYLEMTPVEKDDYVNAVNMAFASGEIGDIAGHHGEHFSTNIHSVCTPTVDGENFLPWHRFFVLDFEATLRQTDPAHNYLSIPYWDWTLDPVHTTFPAPVNFSLSPDFWGTSDVLGGTPSFLALSKFPGFSVNYDFVNCAGTTTNLTEVLNRDYDNNAFGRLPLPSHITTALNLTTFFNAGGASTVTGSPNFLPIAPDFSHRMEAWHNKIHVWHGAGSTMDSGASPLDPSFFLHHGMIDKLWFDWEEKNPAIQSSWPNASTLMPHYDGVHDPNTVTANATRNSRAIQRPLQLGPGRTQDVWYAENGKALLDGDAGIPFSASDIAEPYVYRYTAAINPNSAAVRGEIYAGDGKRSAGTIIGDNQGGFEVKPNVRCSFKAGGAVIWIPGFIAETGSVTEAKIITQPWAMMTEQSHDAVAIQNATTRASAAKPPTAVLDLLNVKALPNPFEQDLVLAFILAKPGKVSLTMHDITGKIVARQEVDYPEADNHEMSIDCGKLPQGLYIYLLETEYGRASGKVTKL